MNDTEVAAPASGRTGSRHPLRRIAVTGLVATLAAMVATAVAAALARAVGVDFEVPEGGETIPVTGVAAALLRWSTRPAERFLRTAVTLTVVSLVPPVLSGANAATTVALVGLHLVAAAVMIPPLTRSLRVIAQRSEHLTGSIDAE